MFKQLINFLSGDLINHAFSIGVKKASNDIHEARKRAELQTLRAFIGKKVILVSNHWEDMIFAEGVGIDYITQAQVPALVVKDVLTGEEKITLSVIIPYSREMVTALFKLSPYERWIMSVKHNHEFWDKPLEKEISDPLVVIEALKTVDFY